MLFMNILTWEPSKRNEVIKRRLEIGMGLPKEAKVIGEWSDVSGGRDFVLTDGTDPKVMMASVLAWSDIIKFEIIPVMEGEEVMKLAKSQAKGK